MKIDHSVRDIFLRIASITLLFFFLACSAWLLRRPHSLGQLQLACTRLCEVRLEVMVEVRLEVVEVRLEVRLEVVLSTLWHCNLSVCSRNLTQY